MVVLLTNMLAMKVMALFGAPVAKEDSALKAVQSSLGVIQVLNEWNKERASQGKPNIEMGIGISYRCCSSWEYGG